FASGCALRNSRTRPRGANAREAPPEAESTRFGSRFMNYPG
ncbi:MAG: hypothetical protein ACI8QZ_003502, partial [Chlamydiales bacterium]